MTTPNTENSDLLLTQTNPAETKKKNRRFAVVVYVACVFGGVLVSGWQKTLAGFSVVPITTLAFQLGVALGPFVFGWLIAKGLSLVLKNISFNTVWAVSVATLVLAAIFGQQSDEISTAASGGNTVQVQPTAKKEAAKSGDAAICIDSYNKQQWDNARTACFSAAQKGDVTAYSYVAAMYKYGYGVNQDKKLALHWYTLAAEKGAARAQWNLGRLYRDGNVVAQDPAQALRWFTLASEQNDINRDLMDLVRFDIGVSYMNGLGVLQDAVRAHMWLNLAEATYASHMRDRLASTMTREQIAEAQKMARDCKAKTYKAC